MNENVAKKEKSTIQKVVDIVLWVFLALAAFTTIIALSSHAGEKDYPVLGKNCFLVVQTDSMKSDEGFSAGDLIISKVLDDDAKETLKVGDVISFYTDLDGDGTRELNTHRIIEVVDGGYKTQGDNNIVADEETVTYEYIEAIWTGKTIKGFGGFVGFLQSSTGFLVCIVLPIAAILIYQIVIFTMTLTKYKQEKNPQPTMSKEEEELIKQKAIEEYLAKQKAEAENKEETEAPAETEN